MSASDDKATDNGTNGNVPQTPSGTQPTAKDPWWRDAHSIMEIIALLAIAGAVFASLARGKLEPEQAVLLLTGGLATVTSALNRRGNQQ